MTHGWAIVNLVATEIIGCLSLEDMSSQDVPCHATGFSTRSDIERAQVDQKLGLGPGVCQPASLENVHDVLLVL